MSDNKYNLTPKQKKFADEYIINGGNGTQAYKDAGYSWKTDAVARAGGTENLAKPNIARYINERLKKVDERALVKQINVMNEIDRLLAEALSVDQLGITTVEEYEADTNALGNVTRSKLERTQKPRINEIAKLMELRLKYEQMQSDKGSGVNINITADGMVDIDEDD